MDHVRPANREQRQNRRDLNCDALDLKMSGQAVTCLAAASACPLDAAG
jgi:hypothetical protein